MTHQPIKTQQAQDAYDALHYAGDLGQLAHAMPGKQAHSRSTFRRVTKIAALILIILWVGSALIWRHTPQSIDISRGMSISLKNQPALSTAMPSMSMPSLSGRMTSLPKIPGRLPAFGRLPIPGHDASTTTFPNTHKELAI